MNKCVSEEMCAVSVQVCIKHCRGVRIKWSAYECICVSLCILF